VGILQNVCPVLNVEVDFGLRIFRRAVFYCNPRIRIRRVSSISIHVGFLDVGESPC